MKRYIQILLVSMFALVLAACGNNDKDNNDTSGNIPEIVDVQLNVKETADVNETVVLSSTVTQGDEKVTDADEVVYEVWEEGKKDEAEMIDSKNNDDGTYTAEKTFEHDGLFHVQVHVTARGMHVMPRSSITVGEGGHYKEHEEDSHHDHTDGFSMHFKKPENAEKNQELELMVHISDDADPMENAQVRYEIWNDNISDKHDWVDTEESNPGEYKATHNFKEAGTYSVQIHVENDDGLHEHEEYEIEVK